MAKRQPEKVRLGRTPLPAFVPHDTLIVRKEELEVGAQIGPEGQGS